MNKRLKKIMVTGASLLMLTSIGAGMNNSANASHNIGWRQTSQTINLNAKRGKHVHLRKNQLVYVIKLNRQVAVIKVGKKYYHLNAKLLKKIPSKKYKQVNQKKRNTKHLIKRVNKKAHTRRNRRRTNKKNVHVLRAHFRRSNNKKLLAKSGFVNYMSFQIPGTKQFIHAGPDIMSKYTPNSRKAVIPKNINVKHVLWLKGHFLQKNPTTYKYNTKAHGWIKL